MRISIHAPRTGSDMLPILYAKHPKDFNPRSPHGERRRWYSSSLPTSPFQSTLPARGATWNPHRLYLYKIFQSTLPARGATTAHSGKFRGVPISIHAPRTGSDLTNVAISCGSEISIHAPRTGSDEKRKDRKGYHNGFQSTLPARGATRNTSHTISTRGHFNPRSPHGERHRGRVQDTSKMSFQSTLPARGATKCRVVVNPNVGFQSTLPARGATATFGETNKNKTYFNPRSPHGERRLVASRCCKATRFQSTLPARGATASTTAATALRGRFQSTLPARGATNAANILSRRRVISIHAPRTGSDSAITNSTQNAWNFNPRSPHGERRNGQR